MKKAKKYVKFISYRKFAICEHPITIINNFRW